MNSFLLGTAASWALAVQAIAPAGQTLGQEQPVWVAAWGTPARELRNVTPMVTLGGDFRPGRDNESVDAEDLATKLKRFPSGRRSLLILRYCHSFLGFREDAVRAPDGKDGIGPWSEGACREVARDWPRILAMLKYCGGSIDLLIGDFEECGRLGTWWMTGDQMNAVRGDPRWMEPRAGLPALGDTLRDLKHLDPGTIKDPRKDAFKAWNLATKRLAAAYMNLSLWEPAKQAFPAIRGSNYQGTRMLDRPAPEGNGHAQPQDNVFGNCASPSLYGEVESIVNLYVDPSDPTRISWSGTTRLRRMPWTSFLLCHQQARACVRSAPDIQLMPWIANASYHGDDPQRPVVAYPMDLRCYDENVRHAALLGVQTFLWWRQDGKSSEADDARIDALVSEINARTLGRVREAADVEPISFLGEVVVSGGRRRDGKWVWRVTASPEVEALREVSTGREWSPTAETLGFWVETLEKVTPKWEVARRRDPSDPPLARPIKPAPPP